MRVIVAGTRTLCDPKIVEAAIKASGFEITLMVTGGCRGIDRLAFQYAIDVLKVPNHVCHANWKQYGAAAGPTRNEIMARSADACIAIWKGKSKGTANMISLAKRYNLKLFVYKVDQPKECKLIDL